MKRFSDPKVSFQKGFYSDLGADGLFFAVTVRSPVSRGILRSISHPSLPAGYALIDVRDVPGSKTVDIQGQRVSVFCSGRISYAGEPLALLAGPDEDVLASLLPEVVIELDPDESEDTERILYERTIRCGPAFSAVTPAAADGTGGASGQDDGPDATAASGAESAAVEGAGASAAASAGESPDAAPPTDAGEGTDSGGGAESDADASAAADADPKSRMFDGCDYVVEREWSYNVKTPYYGETNGALCMWRGGVLTVITPTQWTANLRQVLQKALGAGVQSIIIKKTTAQNLSTASIWYNAIIACQAAVASRAVGRPVRIVYTRREQEAFLGAQRPVRIRHKTGVRKDGRLVSMRVQIEADSGFADPFASELIDRLVIASCGAYGAQNVLVEGVARASRSPALSVNSRQIDCAAFFALENQIAEVCRVAGISPVEFRKINYDAGEPRKGQSGPQLSFDIDKYANVLGALSRAADFERHYAAYEVSAARWETRLHPRDYVSAYSAPLRGIGMACAFEGSPYRGARSGRYARHQTLEVTLQSKTELEIRCPAVSPSVQVLWTESAREILATPALKVRINTLFEGGEQSALPDNIHGNIGVMTALMKRCCALLKKRSQTEPFPVTVKRRTPSFAREWDGEAFRGKPFDSTSFAAASVEVAVDPCTYRGNIRSINIAINGGRILAPQIAAATVRLGVQRILSSLLEDDVLDCENIKISFIQSEREPSQIGELVYKIIPTAYTQAVSQALNYTLDYLPAEQTALHTIVKARKALAKEALASREAQKAREAEGAAPAAGKAGEAAAAGSAPQAKAAASATTEGGDPA